MSPPPKQMQRDWSDDAHDAGLFRFWVTAKGRWPHETSVALADCEGRGEYRAALTMLATKKGVEIP